jgi:N-acetylglucosaminyldiphosphoundecaprenol N-acetyl-beta-D-mannosaminyltransferase
VSKQTQFDKVDILGVAVDAVTLEEAQTYIVNLATPGKPAAYVVKPYVEFFDRSYRDQEVQDILNQAHLVLADGIAVIWAAAFLYAGPRRWWRFWKTLTQILWAPHDLYWPLPARAAGTTFSWPLLQAAAKAGLRVYLVGTPHGNSIAHTAETLQTGISSLTIVGTHDGTDPESKRGRQSESWLDELASALTTTNADLILLGLGFPRQEFAAAYLAKRLEHGVLIGEGGTFDYEQFGGAKAKAPAIMQQLGLEWLWRLFLEPKRLLRQVAIPRFIYRIWRNR